MTDSIEPLIMGIFLMHYPLIMTLVKNDDNPASNTTEDDILNSNPNDNDYYNSSTNNSYIPNSQTTVKDTLNSNTTHAVALQCINH